MLFHLHEVAAERVIFGARYDGCGGHAADWFESGWIRHFPRGPPADRVAASAWRERRDQFVPVTRRTGCPVTAATVRKSRSSVRTVRR